MTDRNKKAKALETLYNDIPLFGRTCFPKAYKKDTPPFHGEICDAFQDEKQKQTLIASPRGSAKSTLVSFVLPMHKVAYKKSTEDLYIVIISESRNQSINFLNRIKFYLDTSEEYRMLYGNLGQATATTWREGEIVLANGARIIAAGTGNRVRGFIHRDTRPNLIIVDDFESETNALTKEARSKNRKWLTEAVIPSLSDDGRLFLIGTVISEDCFLYWAKNSSTWKVLWFAICDKNFDNLLWPDKFPKKRILHIKDDMASVGNLNGFYQEYMNEAQSPENAPFKPAFMKYHSYILEKDDSGQWYLTDISKKDVGEGEREVIPVDIYQGVDPASSLSEHADFFVIASIAIDRHRNYYIIDMYIDKITADKQPGKIIELFKKYQPKRVTIETVAYQEALRAYVRRLMDEEDLYIPGLEKGFKPRRAKNERLFSLVPIFAKGSFYLRRQDVEVEKQLLAYPKGSYDDTLDAIWMAIQKARPCVAKILNEEDKLKDRLKSKFLNWKLR